MSVSAYIYHSIGSIEYAFEAMLEFSRNTPNLLGGTPDYEVIYTEHSRAHVIIIFNFTYIPKCKTNIRIRQ